MPLNSKTDKVLKGLNNLPIECRVRNKAPHFVSVSLVVSAPKSSVQFTSWRGVSELPYL